MTAFKTRIRRCETSPDFATETELAASEPCALYPRGPSQAILRSLKSHSQITASVTPATHSKRPYRNRPGRETAPNLASTTGAVPIGIYRLAGLIGMTVLHFPCYRCLRVLLVPKCEGPGEPATGITYQAAYNAHLM